MFHLKHERSLDFLDGTAGNPQEHYHKSRGTLRTLQQHERVPHTPNQLEMKADSLASTQEESELSTSNSRGVFSQLQVCEKDPEFAASSGMDTEMP